MIFIFGDSWARHSTQHVIDDEETLQTSSVKGVPLKNITRYGYRHWKFENIFVEFNTGDWFNHYFKKHAVINFGEGGNTNSWILENLHTRMAGVSNINEPITVVVYQTDPIRIFAPRKDYTDQNVVWPAFLEWCQNNQFDYASKTIDDLIDTIFDLFYQQLCGFRDHAKREYNLDIDLQIVGGVNVVHPACRKYNLSVLINSVTEFFGYDKDTAIENNHALQCLVEWWGNNVTSAHRAALLKQWQFYDREVTRKTEFWANNPEYFAGRHLTTDALSKLAEYIESKIDQANP